MEDNKRGVTTDPKFHTETFDLARYRLQYGLYKARGAVAAGARALPVDHDDG